MQPSGEIQYYVLCRMMERVITKFLSWNILSQSIICSCFQVTWFGVPKIRVIAWNCGNYTSEAILIVYLNADISLKNY